MDKTDEEISYIVCFLLDKKIPFWYDVNDIQIDGSITIKSHLKELIERGAILDYGKLIFNLKLKNKIKIK